ncbi:MAG: hypothetical protein KJ587_07895 [Alphaproteobacteria bacterium]|nr:hypothetical protein [Alphaproteobacteria bacterium]
MLAHQLLPLVSELRAFDVVDLIAFSRLERSESLKSLVDSAVEQFFTPGNIEILDSGDVRVAWGKTPEIQFNFRLRSVPLEIYFRMLLSDAYGAIGIDFIDCPPDWRKDFEYFESKFRDSLQRARLQPARNGGE